MSSPNPISLYDAELDAFAEAGRRLREVDPHRFRRLLALAQAYVSLHEPQLESDACFRARCAEIDGETVSMVR